MIPARATVIIPTFGYAPFARWAIQSVQKQTVCELEICIICDGSPDAMVAMFRQMAEEDARIQVFCYPKSPRTGEPYRDAVIRQTTGEIICYCAHDDLWLPNHVESMERTLKSYYFTHSIHASVNKPEDRTNGLFQIVYLENLKDPLTLARLHNNDNFFGLTFGAHTRKAYFELDEGWVTTPDLQIATDLYMWKKFAGTFADQLSTTFKITALCFPRPFRAGWSESQRADELKGIFTRIQEEGFLDEINEELNHAAAEQLTVLRNSTNTLLSELHNAKNANEMLSAKQASLKYLLRRFIQEAWHRIKTGHR